MAKSDLLSRFGGLLTDDVSPAGMLGPGGMMFRNRLINSRFGIWQRATSLSIPAGSGLYVADRWLVINQTDKVASVLKSRVTLPDGRKEDAIQVSFATAPTSGNLALSQRVENSDTLNGRKAATSFYLSGEAMTISHWLSQNFGSGGSAAVVPAIKTQALVGGVQTLVRNVFDLPSTDGKTVGDGNHLDFIISCPVRSTTPVTLTLAQLEEGNVWTPHERRPVGVEIVLAKRYYEVVLASARFYASASGQILEVPILYTEKRIKPSMVLLPVTGDTAQNNLVNGKPSQPVIHGATCGRFALESAGAGDTYALTYPVAYNAEL